MVAYGSEGLNGMFDDPRDLTQAPGWMLWPFIKMAERSGMRRGLGRKIRSSKLDRSVWRYFEPLKGRIRWIARKADLELREEVQGSAPIY